MKMLWACIFELIDQDQLCVKRYLRVYVVSGRRCQKLDGLPGVSLLRWIFNPPQTFATRATTFVNTCSSWWLLALTTDPLFELQSGTAVLFATDEQGEHCLCCLPRMRLCSVKRPRRKNVQHCSSEMYQKSSRTNETTSVMVS